MATSAKDLLGRVDDILARKGKEANIDVEEVGVFRVNFPTVDDFADAEVYYKAHKKEVRDSDVVLVYRQIVEPDLNDPELVAALAEKTGHANVPGPWVVDALMQPGQVGRIAGIFMEKAGYKLDSAVVLTDEQTKQLEQEMLAVEANKKGQKVKN